MGRVLSEALSFDRSTFEAVEIGEGGRAEGRGHRGRCDVEDRLTV